MPGKCLTCQGYIGPDQEAEMVSGTPVSYRHASIEDCRAALSNPGVAGQNRLQRVKDRKGHKANLPGLDEMEKW